MTTPSPDVRVRLSAEGVNEVVNALKRIQSEAGKGGKAAASGVNALNLSLGNLKNLIGGLGLASALVGIGRLAKRSIDAADAIGDLRAASGLSLETLSALNLAAKQADVEFARVQVGVVKASKAIDELRQGSPEAVEALGRLGLTLKDLQGLSNDQAFRRIAEQLAQIEGSEGKTAVTTKVLGKAGVELLDVFDKLGPSFDAAVERTRALGLVMDEGVVEAADKAKAQLGLLNAQVEAGTNQFLQGFLPALNATVEALTGGLGGSGAGAMRQFGSAVGSVVKFITAAFGIAGRAIGSIAAQVVTLGATVVDVGSALGRLDFAGARAAVQAGFTRIQEIRTAAQEDVNNLIQRLFTEGTPAIDAAADRAAGRIKRKIGDATNKAGLEVARARAELVKAQAEAERRILAAVLKLQDDDAKRAFDEGVIGLKEFFARRLQVIEQGAAAELAALQKTRDAMAGRGSKDEAERIKNAAQVAALDAQIAERQIQLANERAALTADEQAQVRALAADRIQVEQRILEAQGQRAAAARLGLEQEIQATRVLLQQSGAAADEVERITGKLREVSTAGINFDNIKAEIEGVMSDLALARQKVDQDVRAGLTFSFQAEAKILEIEKERLPVLRDLVAQLQAAASATGDSAKKREAEQVAGAVREVQVGVDEAENSLGRLAGAAVGALSGGLADLFEMGTQGALDFGSAMINLARSFVTSIGRMASEILAKQAIFALLKNLGGGGIPGLSGGGEVQRAAGGGYIRGPGTATSDSIPALLSNGEFVIRAAVVGQPGMRDLLEIINGSRGGPRMPGRAAMRYADGGQVATAGGAKTGPGVRIVNVIDPQMAGEYLASSQGERVILNVLRRNAGAVKGLLG